MRGVFKILQLPTLGFMKILLVNHTLKAGGAERQFVELVKGLSKLDNAELEIFLFNESIEYEELLRLPVKIHIYSKEWLLDSKPIRGLQKVISSFRPDIVHSWHWVCSFYLFPLSFIYKFKFIDGSVRDANSPLLFSPVNIINRICWLRTDTVVANSRAGLEAYSVKKKGKVIYNGLDIDRFTGSCQLPDREWSDILYNPDSLKVGMVARFHNHKDYCTYLEVADRVSRKYPHVYFFAIGEGPLLEGFKNLYHSNKNLIFTGRISYVEHLIPMLDIGVLLTNPAHHAEGLSNALMEFMYTGRPVIASKGGGTPELVKDGDNGLLIEPHAPKDFEKALHHLLDNKELRLQMGSKGKDMIHTKFTFAKMIDSYYSLYRQLCSDHESENQVIPTILKKPFRREIRT